MKKVGLVMLCLLLSGCSHFFNTIKLDTLMTKKIETNTSGMADYNGIISVDTIKELSIKAVNTYFEKSLNIDNVSIGVQFYESEAWKHKPYMFSLKDNTLDNLGEEMNDGIFIVELKNEEADYQVILAGNSGQILQVDNWTKGTRFSDGEKISVEAMISKCESYIQKVMEINPQSLNFEIGMSDFSDTYILYYYDKQTNKISFLIEVNPYIEQIIRCSFGTWSELN